MIFKLSRISVKTIVICITERSPRTLTLLRTARCIVAAMATTKETTVIHHILERETVVAYFTTRPTEWAISEMVDNSMKWLARRSLPAKTMEALRTTSIRLPTWSRRQSMTITANIWTTRCFHPLTMSPERTISSTKFRMWIFQTSSSRVTSTSRISRLRRPRAPHSQRKLQWSKRLTRRRCQRSALMSRTITSWRKYWHPSPRSHTMSILPTRGTETSSTEDRARESRRTTAAAAWMMEVASSRTCSGNIIWKCRGSELSQST